MKMILNYLSSWEVNRKNKLELDYDYISVNGIPELMLDSKNNKPFYRVHADDLSIVTGYPFALDNQWIPEVIYQNQDYWLAFEKYGLASEGLKNIINSEQQKCLISALIRMRQLVINNSVVLNTGAIQDCYINSKNEMLLLSC